MNKGKTNSSPGGGGGGGEANKGTTKSSAQVSPNGFPTHSSLVSGFNLDYWIST
jgi:hypothetical protein